MGSVMIAAFRYRHEAEFARATLEGAGIPSMMSADDGGGMRPEIMSANPVRVYVREEDAAEAAEILQDVTPGDGDDSFGDDEDSSGTDPS
ncbi:hypothetical protein BH23GEM9_BH23GEM9_07490 [soil metagenome]